MRTLELSSARWTVRAIGDTTDVPSQIRGIDIPAAVPGCIHTDLIRAGLIGDPCIGFNELDIQWIGRTDWEYRVSFEVAADLLDDERVDLAFDGLDTIAAILLNGEPAGEAANMFHPHRFDVKRLLRIGGNELIVRFRAPLKYIREMEAKLGDRPVNGDWDPFIFMRKAACNFGWDWGPKVATVGLWKPARLEAWSVARLVSVRPLVIREGAANWRVDLRAQIQRATAQDIRPLRLTAVLHEPPNVREERNDPPDAPQSVGSRELARAACCAGSADTLGIDLRIASAALWRLRGDSRHPAGSLHALSIELTDAASGAPLDSARKDIGFRTISIDTSPDESGSAFRVLLNDEPIFCLGANWIPEGLWPGQVPKKTYTERIEQACAAGMNMLRVWGGGYYESDEFYEECDRRGILVWQDFMFSCAMYPEEAPFPALIEAEARHQITRLSAHPSVALWCGGNECIWGHESWGWKERLLPGQTWGRHYYLELLPRLVAELDPTRPYWPNSPWSGEETIHPNDGRHGDRHTWDVRMEGYLGVPCRFLSEAGHQSPSCYSTLAAALPAAELALGSKSLEHRQRGPGGNVKQYGEVLDAMFRPARSFDEWHAQAHLAQARAVAFAVESALAQYPRCGGVLIWQLNDAWPGLSWSLIDYAGRPKPALSALSARCRPFFHPVAGRLAVSLAALDHLPPTLELVIARVGVDGRVLSEHRRRESPQPMSIAFIGDPEALVGPIKNPREEFYMTTVYSGPTRLRRATWFLAPDKELHLPRPAMDARIERVETAGDDTGECLVLTARTLLKDVILTSDRLSRRDAFALRDPVTLLPGEELRTPFCQPNPAGGARSQPAAMALPPHVWCANHFSAGS